MNKQMTLSFLLTEDGITQLVLQWPFDWILLTNNVVGIIENSKECTTWTSKATQKEKKMVTIDLEMNIMQKPERDQEEEKHIKEPNQGTKDLYVDPEDINSPFIVKQIQKSSAGSTREKHKSNKSTDMEVMVLTNGALNEIRDIVRSTMEDIWGDIKEQYKFVLRKVQQGLKELHGQASQVQASQS